MTKNRLFYGWWVVIIVLAASIILLGVRHSFGVFFKSIGSEFDLPRTTTSAIFSFYMVFSAAFTILGGWSLDRFGPRITLSLMGLTTMISLVVSSWASSVWQLYLSYSFLLSIGTSATFNVSSALVSRWFKKKRGLALGLTSSGSGLGTLLMAPFATYLLLNFNWRIANIVIGVIAAIVIIPTALFLRRHPGEMGLLPDGVTPNLGRIEEHDENRQRSGYSPGQAARMRQFWLLFLIWLFQSFSAYFLLTHIVPHATDVGISAVDAAGILSLLGGFQIAGGLAAGSASDVIGRKGVSIISSAVGAGALFALMWLKSLPAFYVTGVLFGIAWTGLSTMVVAQIGDVFGLRNIGAILGWMGIAWFAGAALGPAFGGFIYDTNQSYFLAFLASGVSMLITALFASALKKPQSG